MNEIMKEFKAVYNKIDLMNEIMEFRAVYNKMMNTYIVRSCDVGGEEKREREIEIDNGEEEQMRHTRVSDFFIFCKK